ncbi:MAG TPA: hypothetical protein VF411_03055 [Bacteroidia bacterium]
MLLLFVFFLANCKKDKKDTKPPVIVFDPPTSNLPHTSTQGSYSLDPTSKTYTMTIGVNARVSDNQHLASVNVTLTDLNHVPQQGSVTIPITSADFTFNINYMVTQIHLQSGTYYIQISADDGFNTTAAYQPISVPESPTLWWGYCAVLKNTPNAISYYDTTVHHSIISTMSLSHPYNGMRYGGYNTQLYINGNNNQPFQAFTMQPQTTQLNYSENATPSQQNYTCLYTDGYKPYVGFLNCDVYSFQNTGSISTSYRLNDINFYPYYFTTTSLYGVAAFKSKIPTVSDKLVTFYGGSGAFYQSTPLSSPNCSITNVIAVFEKQQDSLYVLGNDINNNAAVYIYSPIENSFSASSLITISLGKMMSAVKVNNECIIFSTNSGVYSCNGLTVNTVSLLSAGAQKLNYQSKLNMLTVAISSATTCSLTGYAVYTSTSSVAPLWTWPISHRVLTFGDSLIDFEVITNK